ncbi:LysR family transcriptional regulator [Rhizobium sp. S152]|uniref:LysR family transcriptional regulator n=1 Tax=Rhizobium sp. S152 TaxID=3055038 RepID=UPI0025A97E08|nr:LysR family transcriptional regulator [Rhizobium sp. S152]MDM9624738.1 LysR family transcriptional regulator [Rhizobium sp. S152]
MDLLALADFVTVARHGGFGRAARASGRPKATLSRRVTELEASLGLRLFERGARMLKLTEEGRMLHERAGALLTEIDETAAAIAFGGGSPRGKLRISAPMLFSQTAMGKIAAQFALRYPEIRLEITTEDRAVDMIEEGIDLVIRVNPDPDDNLVGRVFLRDGLAIVADPRVPKPSPGVAVPVVVRSSIAPATTWGMTTSDGRTDLIVDPVLSVSSLTMVLDGVRLGVGAGRLPISLVSHDVQVGRLVLWGNVDGPETELWALYPSRRLLSARVSAFLDFLKEAFPNGTSAELAAYLSK